MLSLWNAGLLDPASWDGGPWKALALFAVGLLAGALNTVAGGGSFLTLPVLIFFGLPATLANGTNRVAIVFQNAGAVWGFSRHKVLAWSWAAAAAVPATAGAVVGALLALRTSDETFKDLLAFFMVVLTLWTLVDNYRKDRRRRRERGEGGRRGEAADEAAGERAAAPTAEASGEGAGGGAAAEATGAVPAPSWRRASPARRWGLAVGFFFVGIYGGFVQAGVGFLILAATSLAGFDLVRGNAVKVLANFCFTLFALAIFAFQGQVEWLTGLVLAVGMVAGSLVGVRLTVLKGHGWVRMVVTVAVIVFAIKLWLD